jgi:excisionase family DNA binding protein
MSAPLTVDQAAERLGVSRWWVYALIRAGRLKTDRVAWGMREVHRIAEKDLRALKIRKVGRPFGAKAKAVAQG